MKTHFIRPGAFSGRVILSNYDLSNLPCMEPVHTRRALHAGISTLGVLYQTVQNSTPRQEAIIRKIVARRQIALYADLMTFHDEWGPCLEWTGPTSGSNGRGCDYARMNLDSQTVAVHRALWVTLFGFLPGKRQLDHLCRNRRCVVHCENVTHKQNQKRRDAHAKTNA